MDKNKSLEQIREDERGYIKGEIVFTIYENENEHFSIAKIKIIETNEPYEEKEIVGKGHFYQLQEGVTYTFYGELVQHRKFGTQYDISAYKTYVPETKEALIAYLSSDLFYGIGKKTATTIVETLGENAIEKILATPEVLDNIPNVQLKTKKRLLKTLRKQQGFEQVAVQLTRYGLSLKMAQTLFDEYGEETNTYIQTNPYQFVFDIDGFGFLTADKIAEMNGINKTSENRIQAAIIYALQQSVLDGHVYLPIDECIKNTLAILQIEELIEDDIDQHIKDLDATKKVIVQRENVYLPSLYYAEDQFSAHVKRILNRRVDTDVTDAELMRLIGDIEDKENISYGEEQFRAIKQALRSKMMILTGGPGTGKTTVIKGIINVYAQVHELSLKRSDYDGDEYPFILAAPTGRAAKRLEESTGIEAMTIHRLLGWDGQQFFEKNEYEKLQGKLLIIDEFSMVDTWLANHLFKAIPNDMQVLIVGDEDQLPSVGPGQVLADLYNSGHIPYITLTEVYRQQDGSKIIFLAHKIKNDACEKTDLQKALDFSFIDCKANQVVDVVITVIERAIQKGVAIEDIQVLAPMYRTNAGINMLNKKIQELVNPKVKEKRERHVQEDVVFRVGDRVLQLVNQPEDGVYNGDIGEIVQLFSAKETTEKEEQIIVRFDETEVIYRRSDYHNITHAYCISIHKAQGSEFPIVILPVVQAYRRMLRKNLLYTAITRSKQSLILCGEKDAFLEGVANLDTDRRYTTLKEKLEEKLGEKNIDTFSKEADETKETLSPYDFMK